MDDMLIYVTGGVAAARILSTINDTDGVIREQFSSKDTRWGWAGGAGAEFALAGGWSVNGELLYLQFRKEQESFRSPLYGAVYSFEHQDSAWIGRVGLNYRWGDAVPATRN